jgi:plastocyanin
MCSSRLLRPLMMAAAALGVAGAGVALHAQSTLQRTPNLSGGWTGDRGVAYFHFLHRFSVSDAPQRKVTSSPTFLMAYSPVKRVLVGAKYATQSQVADAFPNEWELFGRWSALRATEGAPFDASLQAGYNNAAESADAAVDVGRSFGRLRVLATARAFTAAYGGDAAAALGAGAVLTVGPFALAGDAGRVTSGLPTFWSAALQWRIPASPHTISLQVTNANTGTLQGASRGAGHVLYGFEFTIPLTPARYFHPGADAAANAAANAVASNPAGDTAAVVIGARFDSEPRDANAPAPKDTVVIPIKNLAFTTAAIEVEPGTLVRWVNQDPLDHTVTSAGKVWDSGAIKPGTSFERVFDKEGSFPYACTPHPFMKGVVTVRHATGRLP